MARKSKKKSRRSLFSRSKKSKTSKKLGLLGKVAGAVTGRGTGVKRRKPSLKTLATELARIKLKRKIAKERLKVM